MYQKDCSASGSQHQDRYQQKENNHTSIKIKRKMSIGSSRRVRGPLRVGGRWSVSLMRSEMISSTFPCAKRVAA